MEAQQQQHQQQQMSRQNPDVEDEDNIEIAQELADAMNAVVSCSRPIVDAKWLEKSRQVGTSGQTVKPKVYMAMGISGSFQHMGGIKGSPFIVAISKNVKAPIFQVADVGIEADILDFLPELTEQGGHLHRSQLQGPIRAGNESVEADQLEAAGRDALEVAARDAVLQLRAQLASRLSDEVRRLVVELDLHVLVCMRDDFLIREAMRGQLEVVKQVLLYDLREGDLDDKEIEIETSGPSLGVEIMAPPGMEEMTSQLQGMFQNIGGNRAQTRKLKVKVSVLKQTNPDAVAAFRRDGVVRLAGAFGAHALRGAVDDGLLTTWNTAARYHLVHAAQSQNARCHVVADIALLYGIRR